MRLWESPAVMICEDAECSIMEYDDGGTQLLFNNWGWPVAGGEVS
jgi:hypothetical protein